MLALAQYVINNIVAPITKTGALFGVAVQLIHQEPSKDETLDNVSGASAEQEANPSYSDDSSNFSSSPSSTAASWVSSGAAPAEWYAPFLSSSKTLILEDDGDSPASLCARLVLAAKEVSFERRPVMRLVNNDYDGTDRTAIHNGELVVSGIPAIVRYLDMCVPETPLLPEQIEARQEVAKWIQFDTRFNKSYGALARLAASRPANTNRRGSRQQPQISNDERGYLADINTALAEMEETLKDRVTFVGQTITAADLVLFARVEALRQIDVDVDAGRAGLRRWRESLNSQPMLAHVLASNVDVDCYVL